MNEAHGQDYDATQHIGAIDAEEIRVMVHDGLRSLRRLADSWTPQMLPPLSPEQEVMEQALLAWLDDLERIPGMKEYAGPFTTATDKLHALARLIRYKKR